MIKMNKKVDYDKFVKIFTRSTTTDQVNKQYFYDCMKHLKLSAMYKMYLQYDSNSVAKFKLFMYNTIHFGMI